MSNIFLVFHFAFNFKAYLLVFRFGYTLVEKLFVAYQEPVPIMQSSSHMVVLKAISIDRLCFVVLCVHFIVYPVTGWLDYALKRGRNSFVQSGLNESWFFAYKVNAKLAAFPLLFSYGSGDRTVNGWNDEYIRLRVCSPLILSVDHSFENPGHSQKITNYYWFTIFSCGNISVLSAKGWPWVGYKLF